MINTGWDLKENDFKGDIKAYTFDIKQNSKELEEYACNLLISIWIGDSGSSIEVAKAEVSTFINRKKDSTIRMGAVAELKIIVIINLKNYY